MKTSRLFLVLTLASMIACSDQEQVDEELQASDDDQGANQQEMANEDAGDSTNENFNEDQGENQQGGSDQGADLNSDTSNDTDLAGDPAGADGETGNPLANNSGADPLANAGSPPPPANGTASNSVGSDNSSAPQAPAPAPASAPSDTAPIPGGRVLYVPEGGVQVVSEPNGAPVVMLNQGDHPLAWEESGWLKLANGMYVPVGSLSEKGVPRPFNGATFQ